MSKRRMMLRYRQRNTGGGLLSLAVVVMTVLACILISPPQPMEVASVFGHGSTTLPSNDRRIFLPSQSWFLVISNSQAVAACTSLIEAEIIRDAYGELASVQGVETSEISMRVTATNAQIGALSQGADAIIEALHNLDAMAHLSKADAIVLASTAYQDLSNRYASMETALSGTQNAVARGLMGLVATCRQVMSDLLADTSLPHIHYAFAGVVQQYEAYTIYLASAV